MVNDPFVDILGEVTADRLNNLFTLMAEHSIEDDETRQEIIARLSSVLEDLQVLDSPNGFEIYLSEYVAEKSRSDDYDELCRCNLCSCALKDGDLPADLQRGGSELFDRKDTQTLLSEFLRRHPQAEVLKDARREWYSKAGEIQSEVEQLWALAQDSTIPTEKSKVVQ